MDVSMSLMLFNLWDLVVLLLCGIGNALLEVALAEASFMQRVRE